MPTLAEQFQRRQPAGNPSDSHYVSELVDAVLAAAREAGASDVHLSPTEAGLEMHWRIDGVLQWVATFAFEIRANIVARLKVLADLLTYHTDLPQEGRLRGSNGEIEMRVSTFPTMFGEKAVVRLFIGSGQYRFLDDLGLPDEIAATLRRLLQETGGVILVSGPAGSGKTTTLYACLRELAGDEHMRRSLVSLEDPIEAAVPGVAQSQMRPSAGFTYEVGLKSLLRQDPEVIMVGEIRDRATAETVFQASLTGHLVLTSFHAGSAAEAVSRLLDMGVEPYQLRSGLLGVLNQRLLRRLCRCARPSSDPDAALGLPVTHPREAVGCDRCRGTGYDGRIVLTELLLPESSDTGRAILSRSDAQQIEQRAADAGMTTRWQRAAEAIDAGRTSAIEVRRVLGFR